MDSGERKNPMKKLIASFLCLCLTAGIVPAVAESTAATHEITSAEFPLFINSAAAGGDWTLYRNFQFLDPVAFTESCGAAWQG